MSDRGQEIADHIRRFRKVNSDARKKAEDEERDRQGFLNKFADVVNEPIRRIVAEIREQIGSDHSDIEIVPDSDKDRLWFEVTIIATFEGGATRKKTVRFTANPDSKTVVQEEPNNGGFAPVNGAVPIDFVTPDKIEKEVIELLARALATQ